MPTLLLVEDDVKLHRLIKEALEEKAFQVISAHTGDQASVLFDRSIDLVILDLMLPGKSGWMLLKEFKETDIPVLILSAKSLEDDKLFGFELGADDYMTKPFSMRELIARIQVLLKRKQPEKSIHLGPFIWFPLKQQIQYLDIHLDLSPMEYKLLSLFLNQPNQVMTREQLLNQVWGYDYYGDLRTVDTHIKRLRQKLPGFEGIKTIRGSGYMCEVDA